MLTFQGLFLSMHMEYTRNHTKIYYGRFYIVNVAQFLHCAAICNADKLTGKSKGYPPPLGLISFIFMQFLGTNWSNNRLAPPPLELVPHDLPLKIQPNYDIKDCHSVNLHQCVLILKGVCSFP